MKFNLIKIPKIVLLLPLSLIVASCETNFENIKEFGLSSAIIREKSANMAEDIYQSCLRRNKYTTKRFPESLDTLYINLPLKPEENQATPRENNESLSEMDKQNNCQDSKQQSQTFSRHNLILINYMVALGKLAINETINFDRELQDFQKSLNESNDALVLDSDKL